MRNMMWALLVVAMVVAVPRWAQGVEPRVEQKTVFLNEHQEFEPGYAVGNLAIGAADIADYKVMPGRRQLLIFGKGVGKTSLTLWDQNNVKRHEILITVMTREEAQAEVDLRDLLKEFPSVQVRRLRGDLIVTGTVDTEQDLEAVQKVADAARAQNIVRVSPSWSRPPAPEATDKNAAAAAPAPARAPAVTYDVELIEASSLFRTGSYEAGIQPSGSSLFKGEVSAAPGEEGVIFIPASAAMAKDPKKVPKGDVGIRLKVRPSPPDRRGAFTTQVIGETNLPVDSASDPKVWRNSRWEFPVTAGVPFGIAGPDLLAVAEPGNVGSSTESRLGKAADTTSTVAGLPGVSNVPEAGATSGVIGAVRDLFGLWGPRKEPPPTQLVVVLRPRLGSGESGKR